MDLLKKSTEHNINKLVHPLSYAFILIIIAAKYFHLEWLILPSIFALLLTNNFVLFSIKEKVTSLRKPRNYSRFSHALEDINNIVLKESGHFNNKIKIEYIGMTLSNVIDTFEDILKFLSDNKTENIEFNVVMLNPEFKAQSNIRPEWKAEVIKANKERFLKNIGKYRSSWSFNVHYYNHMPCLHGMMINRKHLFLGIARFEKNEMYAGDRSFTYYSKNNNLLHFLEKSNDDEFIDIFSGWYDFCMK